MWAMRNISLCRFAATDRRVHDLDPVSTFSWVGRGTARLKFGLRPCSGVGSPWLIHMGFHPLELLLGDPRTVLQIYEF